MYEQKHQNVIQYIIFCDQQVTFMVKCWLFESSQFSQCIDVVCLVYWLDCGLFWRVKLFALMWIIKLRTDLRADREKMLEARESGRREGDSTSPHWLVEYVGLSLHVRLCTESWLLFPSDCEHVEELRSVRNKDHLSCKSYNETWICTTALIQSSWDQLNE